MTGCQVYPEGEVSAPAVRVENEGVDAADRLGVLDKEVLPGSPKRAAGPDAEFRAKMKASHRVEAQA